MTSYFQLTDEQLKGCVSRSIQKIVAEMQAERSDGVMWDKEIVSLIHQKTGVLYPITTYRSYRAGERMRLTALETLAVAFDVSIATFLGPDRAEADFQRAKRMYNKQNNVRELIELPFFESSMLGASIDPSLAQRLGLKGSGCVLEVTRENNSSTLQYGALAIIDTSYSRVGMSGNYLVRGADARPMIVPIISVGAKINIKMQGDTIEVPPDELIILGRVVGTIG